MIPTTQHSGPSAATAKNHVVGDRRPTNVPPCPLSSPQQNSIPNTKSDRGGVTAGETLPASNPFASSPSDDDSGSSSGQDEFHLERYSQDAARPGEGLRLGRKGSTRRDQPTSPPKPGRRTRPDLNIVTNFSMPAKRLQASGLVIDQVTSQRPRIGPRYVTSVASAKAEHVGHSFNEYSGAVSATPGSDSAIISANVDSGERQMNSSKRRSTSRQAMLKLQELQASRKKVAQTSRAEDITPSRSLVPNHANSNDIANPTYNKGYSPGSRSIVIGIRIPESEAKAHRSTTSRSNVHSANPPDTPPIVITSAEETDSWKPSFFSSEVLSTVPEPSMRRENIKDMPQSDIPPGLEGSRPTPGISIQRGDQASSKAHTEDLDLDDGDDHESVAAGRASSESQERILSLEDERSRHKSQGWWNLMLSPLLSRKGTLVERDTHGTAQAPPMPPVPSVARAFRADGVSRKLAEDPGTPHRVEFTRTRASVSSLWSSGGNEQERVARAKVPIPSDSGLNLEASGVENFGNIPATTTAYDHGRGLAAEYYHACAVEQVKGMKYFECQNHSCEEKLPLLHSVFDSTPNEDPSQVNKAVSSPGVSPDVSTDRLVGERRGVAIGLDAEDVFQNALQTETAAVLKPKSLPASQPTEEPHRQMDAGAPTLQKDRGLVSNDGLPSDTSDSRRDLHYTSYAAPVLSPGPVSPGMQRTMIGNEAVPMAEVRPRLNEDRLQEQTASTPPRQVQEPMSEPKPVPIIVQSHTVYSDKSRLANDRSIGQARKEAMDRLEANESTPQVSPVDRIPPVHNPDAASKKSIFSKMKCLHRKKKSDERDNPKKTKRRWTIIIAIVMFLIVLACILLATLLTRSGDGTPVGSQWLNLTGYPPIPTGISTIARPDAVKAQSQCVAPTTLWSCALPKESQAEVAPNNPDQPNFRFQITFRNGTVPANLIIPVQDALPRSVHLRSRANDVFTNDLFDPNPNPPSRADQIFMGNTTDNITQPFDGEQTPFFISFIPVFPVDPSNSTTKTSSTLRLSARQSSNASDSIPAPDVLDDGSAAPANLLPSSPYPTSQPIKLYNRGQMDEHYGFYMYYDKAIFLHSTAAINTSEFSNNGGIDPEDENGGSTRILSRLRCTFSQTRFLVRMWTNPTFGATLLGPTSPINGTDSAVNSATDFNRPGSFPYPTTISLDRHGGNINKKAVYCYGVDDLQVIQTNVKTIVPENRAVNGVLINPAPALVNGSFGGDSEGSFDQEAGGIDGGTGGCECVWQNWS